MSGENRKGGENDIDLAEIVGVIRRWKFFILLFVAVVTSLAVGFTVVNHPGRNGFEAVLSLSFPGVENRTYPDGSPLDESSILTPELVNRAAARIEGLDINNLMANRRDIIHIGAVMVQGKTGSRREAESPDTFNIRVFCETTSGQRVLTQGQAKRLLALLFEEYKEWFWRKFAAKPLFPVGLACEDIDDPIAALGFLRSRAHYMIEKIDSLPDEVKYLYRKDGKGLLDIKYEIEQLKEHGLRKAERAVFEKAGADAAKRFTEVEKTKEYRLVESSVARGLLADYFSNRACGKAGSPTVVVGSAAENGMDALLFLIEKAFDAEVSAKKIEIEKRMIYESATAGGAGMVDTKSLPELDSVSSRLDELGKEAEELYLEYEKGTLANTIRLWHKGEFEVTQAKEIAVLSFFASLFFAVFAVFFIEFLKNGKKRDGV